MAVPDMAVSILEADEPELLGWAALANLEAMIDDHPHFDAFVALDFMAGAASILVWKAMGQAATPSPSGSCRKFPKRS